MATTSALSEALNSAQREAVAHGPGPLLIVAGPGSGKTRVIAHRIAFLVQEQGVRPWKILAVTFTNKAAREMRDRVAQLLGEEIEGVTLGTFHGISARLLRRYGEAIGVPRGFAIYDDSDQQQVVRRVLAEFGLDPKQYRPRAILSALSRAKSEGIDVATYRAAVGDYFQEIVARVYERYETTLADNAALDFDDLLVRALALLESGDPGVQRYLERLQHVLVDEFQDTNVVQYRLARAWAARTGNLTVVGDPDQSIYSWRAADIRNILHFERDFPDARVVRLEQNYRSTEAVLQAADAVISRAEERIHKQLWTENGGGGRPVLFEAYTEAEEAEYVVGEVQRRVAAGDWAAGDVAVMYRTNAQSRVLEEAFLRHGLPYRLVGGTRFYERREVKDVLAYLRLVHNLADTVAFERVVNVPGRGVGEKTRAAVLDWADHHDAIVWEACRAAGTADGPAVTRRTVAPLQAFADLLDRATALAASGTVVEILDLLLQTTGYQDYLFGEFEDAEERWQNVLELKTVAANYDELAPDDALTTFLEDVALVSDADDLPDGPPDAVTLITLHTAKGLEFPVVFLVGLEEGILPHQRSFDDPASLEEERRLCYVGITRAQRELFFVHAFRRAFLGSSGHNPRSRFIDDIPAELLELRGRAISVESDDLRPARNRWLRWDEFDEDGGVEQAEPALVVQLSEGDEVRHEAFGEGVVLACRSAGADHEVTVQFEDAGVKKLLLSLAPLEKV